MRVDQTILCIMKRIDSDKPAENNQPAMPSPEALQVFSFSFFKPTGKALTISAFTTLIYSSNRQLSSAWRLGALHSNSSKQDKVSKKQSKP